MTEALIKPLKAIHYSISDTRKAGREKQHSLPAGALPRSDFTFITATVAADDFHLCMHL